MRRIASMVSVCLLVAFAGAAMAADAPADTQTKKGTIKSVDPKAKTFVMMAARELMFTCTDKTTYTLDGKESTFDDVVKKDAKATVTYWTDKAAEKDKGRMATKVEVTSGEAK